MPKSGTFRKPSPPTCLQVGNSPQIYLNSFCLGPRINHSCILGDAAGPPKPAHLRRRRGRVGAGARAAGGPLLTVLLEAVFRGPTDHINIGILHSGSKARDKGHSRNHGLQDLSISMVFWVPSVEDGHRAPFGNQTVARSKTL